ncbi:TRAP transporter small permease subunit [Shinella sp. 838]|jgi:TRAP-type C4-dicarboxylate transport system permease small subunit|uniref:TRAP transporter small permease n=1 Tax=Shinella sp. 838 TaxID=3038164 RepID=UPI002414D7D1|nr:TRAP transporter small permease subunit [Shinella sp. 838]MDG4674233.1 TRAP transporter small permease subunit [Shinella sp. 838]
MLSSQNNPSVNHLEAQPKAFGAGMLMVASRKIAACEAWLAGALIFLIFLLLLANVVCRTLGLPLIWADELAVLLMAWVAFVGASMGLAHRQHIAVTLLPDAMPAAARRRLALLVDGLLLVFLAVLIVQLWNWFDPIGLWRAGSVDAFSSSAFNFIYQEPTITLGVPKFWFWLVLPIFCLTSVLHVVASLLARYNASAETAQ